MAGNRDKNCFCCYFCTCELHKFHYLSTLSSIGTP